MVPPRMDVSCACDPGWGDVGCSKQLSQLLEGQQVGSAALPPGTWQFYLVTLPEGASTLVVEMSRTRGDPILFLKGLEEGFEVRISFHSYYPPSDIISYGNTCHDVFKVLVAA